MEYQDILLVSGYYFIYSVSYNGWSIIVAQYSSKLLYFSNGRNLIVQYEIPTFCFHQTRN